METTALVVSALALVLGLIALPAAFQMYWGGPRIQVQFAERRRKDGKRLVCEIVNSPVTSRVLHRLGVRREGTTVYADFEVREVGTNRVVANLTRARLFEVALNGGDGSMRVEIRDHLPVLFTCLIHLPGDQPAIINSYRDTKDVISPGRYRVDVDVISPHERVRARKEVAVGNDPDGTYWLP